MQNIEIKAVRSGTIDYRELKPLQHENYKTLSERAFEKMLRQISEKGFRVPTFVWEDKNDGCIYILDGHQRRTFLFMCAEKGIKLTVEGAETYEVPITYIYAEDKKDAIEMLLAIDSQYGDRHLEGLLDMMEEFEVSKAWIDDNTLFPETFEGIDEAIAKMKGKELKAEEDEYEIPDVIETDIVLGDLFEIGEHRLLCGDSTDIEKIELLIKGDKCNLLTDPPYGIKANKQTLGTGKKQFHRGEDWDNEVPDFFYILSLIDKAIIWGGNYFSNKLDVINDWLCWHKKNDGLSFSEFELAWSNVGKNCRLLSHHWGGEEKKHPTMKPIKVMEWCIEFLDEKPILDIFLGSGSTMVASHQLNRKCYGMELDPKYCQVIVDRMRKLDENIIIKKNGVVI